MPHTIGWSLILLLISFFKNRNKYILPWTCSCVRAHEWTFSSHWIVNSHMDYQSNNPADQIFLVFPIYELWLHMWIPQSFSFEISPNSRLIWDSERSIKKCDLLLNLLSFWSNPTEYYSISLHRSGKQTISVSTALKYLSFSIWCLTWSSPDYFYLTTINI